MSAPELPGAIAIVGPTAAGKSTLGLEVAERLGRPILACDSVQVYRRLDIGSAKPGPAERRRVPHALLDVVDPDVPFSAGDYAARAWAAFERGGGVFVGGTGFYLRATAWTHSADEEPGVRASSDDPVRQNFEQDWLRREREAPGIAHRTLGQRDPSTAASVHPNNLVRVIRALWLCEVHGGAVSEVRKARPPTPRMRLFLVVCDPEPSELDRRIIQRLDAMLAAGWLDEVEQLVADGYDARHKAMRSLGYKQLLDVVAGRMDLATARDVIAVATRQYAKRQRTYFRHQLPAEAVVHVAQPRDLPWDRLRAFADASSPARGGNTR